MFTHDTPLHNYYPAFIAFNMTHRCNYRCTYCPYHSQVLSKGDNRLVAKGYTLGFDAFKAQLDILQRNYMAVGRNFQVNFSGLGEPFLNPDLLDMMRVTAESGLRFGVVSNYSRLVTPHIESMIDMGISLIHTNLDGADPATYEATRPGAKYQTTLKNISRTSEYISLKNSQAKIHVHYILTPENTDELWSFLDIMHELGVSRIAVKMVVAMEYKTDGVFYQKFEEHHDLFDAIRESKAKAARMGIEMALPIYCQVLAKVNDKPLRHLKEQSTLCYTPIDAMWVNFGPMHYQETDLMGNVNLACPMRTLPEHFSWGNLMRDDFIDIINHPSRIRLMGSLQKNELHEKCLSCEYQYLKIRKLITERLAQADRFCTKGANKLGKGRLGEAQRHFEQALRIDPCHQEAHAGLCALLARRSNPAEAEREAKQAAAFGRLQPEFASLRAEALESLNFDGGPQGG